MTADLIAELSQGKSYLRFVITRRDPDSGRRQGLFQACFGLRDQGKLDHIEARILADALCWFNEELARPERLAKARRPHAKPVALSWFKREAELHILKMLKLVYLLEAHHCKVHVLTTDRPGYVVYEDAHQIVAEPYADTPT